MSQLTLASIPGFFDISDSPWPPAAPVISQPLPYLPNASEK
jgi:hypothetical protein